MIYRTSYEIGYEAIQPNLFILKKIYQNKAQRFAAGASSRLLIVLVAGARRRLAVWRWTRNDK